MRRRPGSNASRPVDHALLAQDERCADRFVGDTSGGKERIAAPLGVYLHVTEAPGGFKFAVSLESVPPASSRRALPAAPPARASCPTTASAGRPDQ